MIQNIESQIRNIDQSLAWIKKNKPTDYEQKFPLLVNQRRVLKKLALAARDNPAIAVYGVSQVGKSYLVNCMLQKGEGFMIKADGKYYNFIEEMNPKTEGQEATGVVTRFSSFKKNQERYSSEYPILMRCLSVVDLVLILCEGYYNDLTNYSTPSEQEVEEYAASLMKKYYDAPETGSDVIVADDIMKLKDYLTNHLNHAQSFIHKSAFFDKLALVIDHVPESQWVEVFSFLWNKSTYQTKLFTKMLETLKKLKYSEYVYLPAQALLHHGKNEDTIMSVQCLNELLLDSPTFFTDAYLREGSSFVQIPQLSKSEVCAVCSEVIIKIESEYLVDNKTYCTDNISDGVIADLSVMESTKRRFRDSGDNSSLTSIFEDNDILDFPGARSRTKKDLNALSSDLNLLEVLLRGKVAYLFNMYNEAMLINVLLYCHHAEKNEVKDIPSLLKDWIKNYVGDTMEKRRQTIESTGEISPLFYIGTKFNIDMKHKPEAIANSTNSLNGRWTSRFFTTLYKECFDVESSKDDEGEWIYKNWTKRNEYFNNCYLLRDFKYSGPGESNLYENELTPAKMMKLPEDFYKELRSTFCNNEYVQKFFKNPSLSWDVAASIDNDGSLYIIDQLSVVASKLNKTRETLFYSLLQKAMRRVFDLMDVYYVPADNEELLDINIKKARAIFREMDFTCNNDNYYFGHLIQALQISEAACFRQLHKLMQGPDLNASVNDFKDYEIIRSSCKKAGNPIDEAKEEADKWQCLINTYGFSSEDDALDFLVKKGVDKVKLFNGSYRKKLNSYVIADSIYDSWCASIKSVDFINEFTGNNSFDMSVMTNLVDNLIMGSEHLVLKDAMADAIAEYVDVVNIHTANESLLADILASKINDFVMDFGFSYLSEDSKARVRKVCEAHHIPSFQYILKELPGNYDVDQLTALFDEMSTSPKAILPSFDDNYNKWIEYMFISFVSNIDMPDVDLEANKALSNILDNISLKKMD